MRPPSHFRWPLALVQGLVALGVSSPVLAQQAGSPAKAADMKPYVEKIPGTELKFEMLPIPGGTYEMGSPASEEKRKDDEGPVHPVKIAPFWMGKCEVTWDEFDQFCFSLDLKRKSREGVDLKKQPATEIAADAVTRPTPPYADMTFGFGHKNQPAICMTHHAALEYCRWLSEKTGKLYRLPTEAEWEYACRAGTKTPYSFKEEKKSPGEDKEKASDDDKKDPLGDYAWYVENAEKPMPVGKKKANPWGLHDMHGNVAEWCMDHYAADVYSKFAKDQPSDRPVLLPDTREYPYVARGGSWDDDADRLRSAARLESNLEFSMRDPQRPQSIWWHTDAQIIGFRVVRPLEEQENLKGFKSPIVKAKGSK